MLSKVRIDLKFDEEIGRPQRLSVVSQRADTNVSIGSTKVSCFFHAFGLAMPREAESLESAVSLNVEETEPPAT